MTPEQLKASILKYAMQGKLVEQRSEEGTGEDLYCSIVFTEKKSLKPISDDKMPFDIPLSWKWIRHNELFEIIGGSQPPKSKFEDDPREGYVRLYQIRDYGEKPVPVFVPRNLVSKFTKKGDILLARYGASVGKVFWAEEGAYNVAMAKSMPLFEEGPVLPAFVYYYYLAPLYQTLVRNNSRSAQAGFNKEDLNGLLFPLPPLAEQKRIVAKIEELLPYVDRYAVAYEKLEQFNAKFPEDMKKSILQYAIQGKLVEQRPEEGTGEDLYHQIQTEKQRLIKEGKIKKEKPLAEIAEDEIPFDIPESWKRVRLLDVVEEKPANGFSPKGVDYQTAVKNLTLTATTSGYFKADAFKYVDIQLEPDSKYWLKKDDLLIQRSNSRELVGTSCIYTGDDDAFIYPDLMMKLRVMNGVDVKYVDYVLKSPLTRNYFSKNASGTSESMPKINQGIVSATLIPLPPLAEQKRIVAKLEEILPLCERLK